MSTVTIVPIKEFPRASKMGENMPDANADADDDGLVQPIIPLQ